MDVRANEGQAGSPKRAALPQRAALRESQGPHELLFIAAMQPIFRGSAPQRDQVSTTRPCNLNAT
jgi:hypothetical protein